MQRESAGASSHSAARSRSAEPPGHGPGNGGHVLVALGSAPAGWRPEARTFPPVIAIASGAPCSGMPNRARAGSSAQAGTTRLVRQAERASEANSERFTGRVAVLSASATGGRRFAAMSRRALCSDVSPRSSASERRPGAHGQQTCRDRHSLHGHFLAAEGRVWRWRNGIVAGGRTHTLLQCSRTRHDGSHGLPTDLPASGIRY